jgi:pyruvate formate lyase activating enzyme
VYTGNVHDTVGGTTRCTGCRAALVVRDWYHLDRYRLTGDGHCPDCGTRLAGVFDGPPGKWGPRRRPVQLATKETSS